MPMITLKADISANGKKKSFVLSSPVSVSRFISTSHQSQAFSLPEVTSSPFKFENVFVGDVLQGGSCNVDVLSMCPHNLTHIETSAHILNQTKSEATISDIPNEHFQGLVYVIDLTSKLHDNEKLITINHLKNELLKITFPIRAIALKTKSSSLPQDYDFSGKDFIALSKEAAKELIDFAIDGQKITTLILDLPSTDPENDNGLLIAHRTFFEIPATGIEFKDTKKKVISELAYFKDIIQNYYYFIMTPAKIKTNAIISDILFYPLLENKE